VTETSNAMRQRAGEAPIARRGVKLTEIDYSPRIVSDFFAGRRVYLYPADRREIIRRLLLDATLSNAAIAARVECDVTTVRRARRAIDAQDMAVAS
jgi:hypothetical protein